MIRIGKVKQAYRVLSKIPELDRGLSAKEFASKVPNDSLILTFECENELAGFKIGYPLSDHEFYSWLGGVTIKYRNKGIAQQLLEYQESWVTNQGFLRISVKSTNRNPAMIRLLVRNGYKIKQVDSFGKEEEKIHFLKVL